MDDAVVQGQQGVDVGLPGGGVTLGAGVQLYFSQTLAVDLQLLSTWGQFTEVKVDDVTREDLDIDAHSARFSLGISWWR